MRVRYEPAHGADSGEGDSIVGGNSENQLTTRRQPERVACLWVSRAHTAQEAEFGLE